MVKMSSIQVVRQVTWQPFEYWTPILSGIQVFGIQMVTVFFFFLFRNCLCLYKDPKNVDRFSLSIQFVIYLCVSHLKTIQTTLKDPDNDDPSLWSQEETERMLQFVAKVIYFALGNWKAE